MLAVLSLNPLQHTFALVLRQQPAEGRDLTHLDGVSVEPGARRPPSSDDQRRLVDRPRDTCTPHGYRENVSSGAAARSLNRGVLVPVRRSVVRVLAAVTIASTFSVLAPSAAEAAQSFPSRCATEGGQTVNVIPGEVVTITDFQNPPCNASGSLPGLGSLYSFSSVFGTAWLTINAVVGASGTAIFSSTSASFTYTFVVVAPSDSADPVVPDLTPPPWFQSYARGSFDETCRGGWDASWAEWPHGHTGGWVCDRSIPSFG